MPTVRYEEMHPHELQAALAKFPVAYVPFGSLEWHGRHLPYGNDSLKVHHLLILTAEQYGGVVLPPTYWGMLGDEHGIRLPGTMSNFGQELTDQLYTIILLGLVERIGFKVVIGLTGHDVPEQVAAIQRGVEAIQRTGKGTGFAMMEGDLYDQTEDHMDHAGHWETSLLMYFRPELVDMTRIADEDLETREGHAAAGIWGKDPRQCASPELGAKLAQGIVDSIGRKAQELLASLG